MDNVRNFISVSGLASTDELPVNKRGMAIQYSDTETVFIPDNHPEIKSIFQVILRVEIQNSRYIRTPAGITVILDGTRKLKFIYTGEDDSGQANFWDLQLPYNTFFELPEHTELENAEVYILDAYFSLLDKRKIYSHCVYWVNVKLCSPLQDNNKVKAIARGSAPKSDKKAVIIPKESVEINIDKEGQTIQKPSVENSSGKNGSKAEEEILIDLDAEYL